MNIANEIQARTEEDTAVFKKALTKMNDEYPHFLSGEETEFLLSFFANMRTFKRELMSRFAMLGANQAILMAEHRIKEVLAQQNVPNVEPFEMPTTEQVCNDLVYNCNKNV